MDDNKKGELLESLSEESISVFIFSNILHAIDNNYIDLNIEDVHVVVKRGEKDYEVTVSMEKNGKGQTHTLPLQRYDSVVVDQLRAMMGLTMKILSMLEAFSKNESVLRIVR